MNLIWPQPSGKRANSWKSASSARCFTGPLLRIVWRRICSGKINHAAQPHGRNASPIEAGQRQPYSPQPRAARLPHPMAFGRRSVQIGALRERVTTSYGTSPPLTKALSWQRHAKSLVSPSRQLRQPAARNRTHSSGSSPAIRSSRNPPTASSAFARIIASPPQASASPVAAPTPVAKPVVNRLLRVPFASPAAHGYRLRACNSRKEVHCSSQVSSSSQSPSTNCT